jgi:hypothetical protein
METPNEKPEGKITIRDAFPALPAEKEAEVEARLARYVALVFRIYEHIRRNPEKYAVFQWRLTEPSASDSMDSMG